MAKKTNDTDNNNLKEIIMENKKRVIPYVSKEDRAQLNEGIESKKIEKDLNATTNRGNGLRFNHGKLRHDLVHPKAYEDFVQVLTDGANKYKPRNWENGLSWTSVIASLKRHITAMENGEDFDPESGRLHIAHAACNVHFLNAFYHDFPQGDDRPKRFLKLPKIGFDVDGVLANFMKAWHVLHPEIPEFPSTWFTDNKMGEKFLEMREAGTLNDFYLNIEPLIKADELKYEPHCYITSRPVPKEITEQWLLMHGFPSKPVYSIDVRKSKVEIAKESGIEIFIEDFFDNFVELNNNNIFTFLLTQPWNEKYDIGHMRINTLNDLPFLKR